MSFEDFEYSFTVKELNKELQTRIENHTKKIDTLLTFANTRAKNKEELVNYCNELKGEIKNMLFTIDFMKNKVKR